MSRRRPPGKPPGTYVVGYGRPPEASRFKPGQSGNPRGRPKAQRSPAQMLSEVLGAPVAVTQSGRRKRMPMLAYIFERLTRDAAKGDQGAVRTLVQLARGLPHMSKADVDARGNPIDYGAEVRRKLNDMSARIAAERAVQDEAASLSGDHDALGSPADDEAASE